MEIVIEYVLIENLLLNLIVLKTTALFVKEKGRLFLLSAFLGGCFTVVLPLIRLNAYGHLLTQMGVACIYVCLSFKFSSFKKFLTIYLCYFVSSFVYGGAVYFVETLIGQNFTMLVLSICIVMFVLIKILYKRLDKKKNIQAFCFQVHVCSAGKNICCTGFLDSGNMLTDPVTNQPVCLINFKLFSQLFEHVQLQDILTEKVNLLKLGHYINFSTLNHTDKILVFQVDKMLIDNKTYEKPILGLSLKNFGFGTDMILHNSFA